jgi:integrase
MRRQAPPGEGAFKDPLSQPDESRTFLNAIGGDRYEALYVLAITTGMRQGELLGLQWPDLDLEDGKLTIFRSLHRTKRRRDPEDIFPGSNSAARRRLAAGAPWRFRRSLSMPCASTARSRRCSAA